MNRTKCPQCGYYVQADWFSKPGGEEFALCPNHETKTVQCQIIVRESEKTDE